MLWPPFKWTCDIRWSQFFQLVIISYHRSSRSFPILREWSKCWCIFSDSILASKITNIGGKRECYLLILIPTRENGYFMMQIDIVYCFHFYFSVGAFMVQSLISNYMNFSGRKKFAFFCSMIVFYYLEWRWFLRHKDTKRTLTQTFQSVSFKFWINKS